MLKENRKTLIVSTLTLLIPMVAGLLLWNRLPEKIPTHWNMAGEVDGWGSKVFAVFGLPGMLIAVHLFCLIATGSDPSNKKYNPKVFTLIAWLCPVIGLTVCSMVYSSALGYNLSVEIIVPVMVGLLLVIIGNLLPKCKQSYTIGIKLPWTLASEENWNKTHRLAGKLWVCGGVLVMVSGFLRCIWILLGALLVLVFVPMVYSFLYYIKHEQTE